jgi:Histidine kinase-, DNA gyrase B-, and HSP90-like ATPase
VEDVMVLSRSEPNLAEVVRAAVAEVPHQPAGPPVRLRLVAAPAVARVAVDDLVRLLAELLENAVVFSPPGAEVQVTGRPLPGRYELKVQDGGIGMGDDALARVNRHLADPPLVDLASSPLIGLLAAGRLARRHGIQIRVGHAADGGTEALVLLPETLLVHQPGPGQPAPPAEPAPIYDAVRADWLQVSYEDPVAAPRASALPRRTPMANLNSLLRDPPATLRPATLDQRRPRSPDQVRSLLTSFQNGIREARSLLEA